MITPKNQKEENSTNKRIVKVEAKRDDDMRSSQSIKSGLVGRSIFNGKQQRKKSKFR